MVGDGQEGGGGVNLFPKNGIPIEVCLQDFELHHEGEF
jgi:hypothetical protein